MRPGSAADRAPGAAHHGFDLVESAVAVSREDRQAQLTAPAAALDSDSGVR
jgi:hypothetical protein